MQKPQILIVGAGPTGLMMACQLTVFGIPFRIIEKNDHPVKESRALGIQARTLEIFRQMGIVDEFLKNGQKTKALNYIVGNITRRIPIGELGQGISEYPFLLMHEQSKTEKVFNEFLQKHSKKVEWGTELVRFTQDLDGVTAVIKEKKGKEEIQTFDYVVGADGARSVVRHGLGIELAGATYHQLLYVLDCKVESSTFKDNEIYLSLSKNIFTAFFPLAHNVWRIIGVVPDELSLKKDITFEDIQAHFSEHLTIPVKLSHPNWISVYHSHHRCVKEFRLGRCFLTGDAAHIHSPVGAQGMNTGLQDAYNLAWKLAFVLQGKADPALLDTYNEERLPFAQKLVETTDRAFSLVVSENPLKAIFTKYIAPLVMKEIVKKDFTRMFMFKTISQTGISYKEGPLSQNASFGIFPKISPLPGDRLPFIFYTNEKGQEKNIQELVTTTKMELLIFENDNTMEDVLNLSLEKYKDTFHITVIKGNKELFEAFGIVSDGFYLVRPDMYISYRSQGISVQHFEKYLQQFFIYTI
ncbi:MAG TPA: FAD-dependent monooxygenase [Candidatus Saccharimonadales bacterium]|nr:FAD-dependent monooxygenase [Candidatus Saccharimonadales bacterium]